jgi:hypothetical protein
LRPRRTFPWKRTRFDGTRHQGLRLPPSGLRPPCLARPLGAPIGNARCRRGFLRMCWSLSLALVTLDKFRITRRTAAGSRTIPMTSTSGGMSASAPARQKRYRPWPPTRTPRPMRRLAGLARLIMLGG